MIRGEIWWADFGIPFGSEPGFKRPVLVLQADAINQSKINTTIVVPLTTNLIWAEAPGNVFLEKDDSGLSKDSVVVVTQICVIDKQRLIQRESTLSRGNLKEVEAGIQMVLGIN
jgi:mRNA interferase MazF